ncbi:TraR/DksA family transcriptional regulator [Halopseudomonas salegens]|uniref:Transcriptional regulator, TraR/DksA family n=1 Tax=Halopseudomonas salegens TaxID=1434072 RepID=A0A1H2GFG5_9GAMM|nr:TraR/DksA C4-type zinc finger protein [Halopseudomonas salegens]SDU18151.1 transcriptional regulator, TraR/DksA family [Halopseudomonas salegens]
MDAALKAELRQLLHSRLQAAMQQAEGQSTRSEAVELDQAKVGRLSRMDALQQQAMQDATQARVNVQVQRLQRALQQLDSDDFGDCVECGEAITPGRLRIDPAITLCVDCAAELGG